MWMVLGYWALFCREIKQYAVGLLVVRMDAVPLAGDTAHHPLSFINFASSAPP